MNAENEEMVNEEDGGMTVESALQNGETLMDFDD